MDLVTLKKKLSTYESDKGYLKNVGAAPNQTILSNPRGIFAQNAKSFADQQRTNFQVNQYKSAPKLWEFMRLSF